MVEVKYLKENKESTIINKVKSNIKSIEMTKTGILVPKNINDLKKYRSINYAYEYLDRGLHSNISKTSFCKEKHIGIRTLSKGLEYIGTKTLKKSNNEDVDKECKEHKECKEDKECNKNNDNESNDNQKINKVKIKKGGNNVLIQDTKNTQENDVKLLSFNTSEHCLDENKLIIKAKSRVHP